MKHRRRPDEAKIARPMYKIQHNTARPPPISLINPNSFMISLPNALSSPYRLPSLLLVHLPFPLPLRSKQVLVLTAALHLISDKLLILL
ncbi:hypothetical protein T440DRAFT_19440 [Plenodomus tracheiphilus IPT5]|uniref:Uncharacterized protein n=1 Tax=Plenodomus tracheiphilus IPT5 TaxID=1408161 RepID=A0A6A7BC24_9PLEO|nr:hypothetical protein T440DRAFT_19440 [Plenodomus tracheiphilus IPT5]